MSAVAAAILKLYADETGRAMTPEQQEDDLATLGAAVGPGPGTGRGPRGEAGMVRLVLQVGRNAGVRPQDIVGAIANEAQIPGRAIGAIDILDAYTFVDIPQEFVERVLGAMRSVKIKGRFVNPEVAGPGSQAPRGDGGRGGFGGQRGGGGFDRGARRDGPRGGYDRGPRDGGGTAAATATGSVGKEAARATLGGIRKAASATLRGAATTTRRRTAGGQRRAASTGATGRPSRLGAMRRRVARPPSGASESVPETTTRASRGATQVGTLAGT
jgi:hypothetical protein